MSSNVDVVKLAKFLKDNLPGLGVAQKSKNLTYNSTPLRHPLFLNIYNRLSPSAQEKLCAQFSAELGGLLRGSEDSKLQGVLQNLFMAPRANPSQTVFNDSIPTPLAELKLILNTYDLRRSFLYDAPNDRCYPYDYEYLEKRLSYLLGEGYSSWSQTHTEHCRLSYWPHISTRITRDEKDGHKVFNSWQEPLWHKTWDSSKPQKCPVLVEEYLSLLVEDKESLQALKAWIRDAIFSKADPILVLHGTAGAGKTFFVKNFCGAFFDSEAYHMSPSIDFGSDKFQAELSNCQLFHIEEGNLTDESREYLKMVHNGKMAIKRKFKDVGTPEDIHASIVMTMNPKHRNRKIRLEYSDRKFFVPNLNPKPLLESWGQQKIDALMESLKDISFLQATASYFYHEFKEGQSKVFPKTSLFKELCINSYDYFFRHFIGLCRTNEEVTSSVFKRAYRHVVEPHEIEQNIKHYEDNFKEKLATMTIESDGRWTALSHVCQEKPQNGKVLAYANGSGHAKEIEELNVGPSVRL